LAIILLGMAMVSSDSNLVTTGRMMGFFQDPLFI